MIIKSLSRKVGGSAPLLKYILRYVLKDEKREPLPKTLVPLVNEARTYKSTRAFEKALNEKGQLLYHGTPKNFSGSPKIPSDRYGTFGNGFYLATKRALAKKYALETGVIKKYIRDPEAKFFDAGKKHEHYLHLWNKMSRKELNVPFMSISDVHDRIREHLITKGYQGIHSEKQTVVFDVHAIAELPTDFYKKAKQQPLRNPNRDIEKQSPLIIRHNIRSRSLQGYIKEFEQNEARRIYRRKNNIKIYHSILSFSAKDKKHVTENVLKDMAKKYIELHGKNNLYIISSHHDREHIHLHAAVSGTQLNGRSSRISKQKFHSIKLALDRYQREKYPQLVNSLPEHGKSKRLAKETIVQAIKAERQTNKQALIQSLEKAFVSSKSQEQFISKLTALGHQPYFRNGNFQGIRFEGKAKYRLANLGIGKAKLQELDKSKVKQDKTLTELQNLRSGRSKEQKRDILEPTSKKEISGNLTKNEKQALEDLSAIRGNNEERELGVSDSNNTHSTTPVTEQINNTEEQEEDNAIKYESYEQENLSLESEQP